MAVFFLNQWALTADGDQTFSHPVFRATMFFKEFRWRLPMNAPF